MNEKGNMFGENRFHICYISKYVSKIAYIWKLAIHSTYISVDILKKQGYILNGWPSYMTCLENISQKDALTYVTTWYDIYQMPLTYLVITLSHPNWHSRDVHCSNYVRRKNIEKYNRYYMLLAAQEMTYYSDVP